jgi:predicted acylesterase/phospholipase RssA
MKLFFKHSLLLFLLTLTLHAEREKIKASMVISGGVSLGAYESGYNWALINMLKREKATSKFVDPELLSVAGASAGSINSLLTAMYWCQENSVPLKNTIDDNLFYETWVHLGIEDLAIKGEAPHNQSSLFTQDGLRKKGKKIIEHLKQPIFEKNCEVPLGVAVTKVTPIVESVSGINIKNQNFSVPLVFKVKNGQGIVENKTMPPSSTFYISIPGIEKDRHKLINLLLASGAFPAAFQQVKLDYAYKGKKNSAYFVDGGLYDNVPLDLAISLDDSAEYFFFMDPSNMRKEKKAVEKEKKEELPVGFITPNLMPLFSSFDIMQSMKLYQAINKNFRGNSDKTLILSSRYHPIAGEYLGHFGAFLDINFRVYDYYVGVYDAIYHVAAAYIRKNRHAPMNQIELMDYLKTVLGLDKNPEALAAYTLFLNTEFYHTKPKTTDRFSAIYNAFNLKKPDATRYSNEEFKIFLSKLDMKYMEESKNSFIVYAKKDIDNWYKRPLREVISRIALLENDRARAGKSGAYAVETSLGAWASTSFLKEKRGFEFFPMNIPDDKRDEDVHMALKFLPQEVAADLNNGGLSFGYTPFLYHFENKKFISGIEGKASYVAISNQDDFIRGDLSIYKGYEDFLKFGVGASFFGNVEGKFYQSDSAYGLNTYVDILDIFRFSYVRRNGDRYKKSHIYFGIENIPSLIYWLNR